MDQHLTDLDHQIADVETELAHVEITLAAIPRSKKHARERAAVTAKRNLLRHQHAQLVARVQRWTVGASRGMEVG